MYRIAICDDDAVFIEYIKQIILQCDLEKENIVFSAFFSGEDLIEQLDQLPSCELLILDMKMKKMDGHATARQFRQSFPDSVLVFCSGVSRPTDESFKVTPYRFLDKSYSDKKMLFEMTAILKKMVENHQDPVIVGKNHNSLVKLRPNDIVFIENCKYGSMIHVRKDKIEYSFENRILTKRKLIELYSILKEYDFEYAHNSYIINLKYVTKLTSKGVVRLADGRELNVSRSKSKTFREALANLLDRKYL